MLSAVQLGLCVCLCLHCGLAQPLHGQSIFTYRRADASQEFFFAVFNADWHRWAAISGMCPLALLLSGSLFSIIRAGKEALMVASGISGLETGAGGVSFGCRS